MADGVQLRPPLSRPGFRLPSQALGQKGMQQGWPHTLQKETWQQGDCGLAFRVCDVAVPQARGQVGTEPRALLASCSPTHMPGLSLLPTLPL